MKTITKLLIAACAVSLFVAAFLTTRHLDRSRSAAKTGARTAAAVAKESAAQKVAPPKLAAAARAEAKPAAAPAPSQAEEAAALERLDVADLKAEIATIDGQLDSRKAIERLNKDEASADERIELGKMLQRQSLLRHELARRQLKTFEERFAAYALTHGDRVAKYSGR